MISTFQQPPVDLYPVNPSQPDQSFITEIEIPRTLMEAKTAGTDAYTQTLKKTEVPMGKNRPSANVISQLSPIPTVESPSIPEQREMTLAAPYPAVRAQRAEPEKGMKLQVLAPMGRNHFGRRVISELSPVPPVEPPSMPKERGRVLATPHAAALGQRTEPEKGRKSQVLEPMGRNHFGRRVISELSPVPPVQPPSMPQLRQIPLIASHDVFQGGGDRFEIAGKPQTREKRDRRWIRRAASASGSPVMVPNEKPTSLSLPVPGSPKGAAFLFVLDTSGSVKGLPLEGIKNSALEFVRLMGENDRAAIMVFNDRAHLVRPFTSEKKPLEHEINNLRIAGRWTVLFDALVQAIDVIQKEDYEDKFVILFSDGKDEGSRSTMADVIRTIRRSGVSILSVGYSKVERKYLDTLETIAGETGGVFTDAPQLHDIMTVLRVARGVSAFLSIDSDPTGAEVFVDGGFRGKTPLDLELPFGKYELSLTSPGYHDWEAQVELGEEGDTPLLVRLVPVKSERQ
jgi:Mg-chelatase subunit ChlD